MSSIQKLIEKIKKLLALSASSNENEAAIAAQKASLLLTQHNLTHLDIKTHEIKRNVLFTASSIPQWKKIILSSVAENNGCQIAAVRRIDGKKDVTITGTQLNITVCTQLIDFLYSSIERLCKNHNGKGKLFLTQFRLGCSVVIAKKFYEQSQELQQNGITVDNQTSSALTVRSMIEEQQKQIDQYLADIGVQQENTKIPVIPSKRSPDGFITGLKEGNEINLSKQINGQ